MKRHNTRIAAFVAISLAACGVLASTPVARASEVAYLLNVTVRPGYNFANAQTALAYGYAVCDKIANGVTFAGIAAEAKSDFKTSDEYQASYVISQAAQELCPQHIWALRRSAAGYMPPPAH
jgi:Protein of unknown function (DUF732)